MNGAMPCPQCGAAMNRHAEKMREPRTADEARVADAALYGVLEQHHLCPACGETATRLVPFPFSV